jgi:hypothetical protein
MRSSTARMAALLEFSASACPMCCCPGLSPQAAGNAAGGAQAAGRAGRCGDLAGFQVLVRCRNSQDALVTAIARMAAQQVIAIQAS